MGIRWHDMKLMQHSMNDDVDVEKRYNRHELAA